MLSTLIFLAAAVIFGIEAYKKQTALPLGFALIALGLAL